MQNNIYNIPNKIKCYNIKMCSFLSINTDHQITQYTRIQNLIPLYIKAILMKGYKYLKSHS